MGDEYAEQKELMQRQAAIEKMDELEKEQIEAMPEIIATAKGQSLEELRKEFEVMSSQPEGTSHQTQGVAGPIQAVKAQTLILDRMSQTVINIIERLEFVMKKPESSSSEVKSDWGDNPVVSPLANAQAKLAYEMEALADRLMNLYKSLDV